MTPSFLDTSHPELVEITGILELRATVMGAPSASASGIVTATPSGFAATVASISCDIATISNFSGARYSTKLPVSFPPSSAPFLTGAQNESDAAPCVTTIICSCFWAITAAGATSQAANVAPINDLRLILVLSFFWGQRFLKDLN